MSLRKLKIALLGLMLVCVPLLYSACGGTPAGPPAPLVEIPSPIAIKFVEYSEIRIDLSTISTAAESSINADKAVGAGGEFSSAIMWGALNVEAIEASLVETMRGLSEMEIPVGTIVTTYETMMRFSGNTGILSGMHYVKIDFADFDFDGDGITEGCSGHTAALPVCVRFWLGGKRFIAWVFDTYPVEGNPGKGRYKIYYFDYEDRAISTAAHYDHRDPENKSTEIHSITEDCCSGHAEMLQVGPEESALKRLNLYAADVSPGEHLAYLGQFIEGKDFWSGSVNFVSPASPDGVDFTNECAVISTGNAADDSGICDVLGISVAGIPFVDPAQPADVEPADFPAAPTF